MRTQEISASRCAFAVLETPAGTGRDARRELLFQLESVLPQPLESMHAVFERFDGGVLACACDRAKIESSRSVTDRLIPDSIPEWAHVKDPELIRSRLNLLAGEMRPLSSLRRSRLTAKLVCGCSILMLLMLFIGTSHRMSTIDQQQASLKSEITAVYESVLPRASSPNAQPNAVRFSTILNQARSTRTGAANTGQVDLVQDLSDLLGSWPRIEDLQVDALTIQPDTIRLLMSTPDNESSTAAMEAVIEMPGWLPVSRTTTPRADRVELNAVLARSGGGDQK